MTTPSKTDTAKALKNAYARDWRRKNPDRVRKHMQTYWERKAEEFLAESKKSTATQ